MVKKMNKKKQSLIGGVAGLLVGAWMLFYLKDMLGFIPAGLGIILLIYNRR